MIHGLSSQLRCETSSFSHRLPAVFQKGQRSCQNLDDDFRYGNLFTRETRALGNGMCVMISSAFPIEGSIRLEVEDTLGPVQIA